jgi:hypothetical protein
MARRQKVQAEIIVSGCVCVLTPPAVFESWARLQLLGIYKIAF